MKSLFNRLTGKAVSRTAFVEHLGHEVVQHHPNWKVMISTDHKLMRIDTGHQTVEITLDDAYKRYQAAPDPLEEVAADMLKQLAEMLPTGRCIVPVIKKKPGWIPFANSLASMSLIQRSSTPRWILPGKTLTMS